MPSLSKKPKVFLLRSALVFYVSSRDRQRPLFAAGFDKWPFNLMNVIEIRHIASDEWELYKDIRLRSLKESPDAFGSTSADESVFPVEKWQERVSVSERVGKALPLIAKLDGISVGIACGVLHSTSDKYGQVYQMWVDPRQRGNGVGKLLLSRIIEWARQ